ncbi:NAD-dependent epimerase/dehydratase family protein [Paenibacillus wulumuqiensis]|uniref:NAD-dependent epimerase/dehydratase family protein n=1 Tax=Paenibacillus wulumuqiensis TaxID=1567107 RepID=UPI000619B90A|nr:NAD-dependent epimerase/dehydratase family protein [Paenibacillus wulumuqiensis]
MRQAVVLGATGGTGKAIVMELLKRGTVVTAFGRSMGKLKQLSAELGHPSHLHLYEGNVFETADVYQAAQGLDVIFHCASVPYHEMESRLLPMGISVLSAAERLGIRVVAVDGIYPYSSSRNREPVDETYPKQPITRKGKVKLQFEQLLFHPRWSSMQGMIVRLPDYYGPTANDASYLGSTLKSIAAGQPSFFIGNMHVPREYVYLPDAAVMIVELACREEAYGQNWHIPSAGPIAGKELIRIAQQAAGITRPVIPMGKITLSLIGAFQPVLKEVVEMLYLTRQPLILSGAKYEHHIGPILATPYEKGMTHTIHCLQNAEKETLMKNEQ